MRSWPSMIWSMQIEREVQVSIWWCRAGVGGLSLSEEEEEEESSSGYLGRSWK